MERNVKCQIEIISEYPSQRQLNNADSIKFDVQRDVSIMAVPKEIVVVKTIYSLCNEVIKKTEVTECVNAVN